jgi:DNA (cytosine-5)-methyltransferase 1
MTRPLTVLSLFSGCGGLDLGFEAAGFKTSAMVEIAPYAVQTLRKHFPESTVFGPPISSGDITSLDINDLPSKADVLIGGPPCQSFSIAAAQRFLKGDVKFKRTGFGDNNRGGLIHSYLSVLAAVRPKTFVIENVPGLMNLDNGRELENIIYTIKDLGYHVNEPTVFQAADFGVPQYRQRLIIVGSLGREKARLPIPTHNDSPLLSNKAHKTVGEALARFPKKPLNHVPREHAESSLTRYRGLSMGQREKLGRVDRLDPYRPSKTVIAGGSNGGGRSHLHPFLARTLTVRECARIQTFPDNYEFLGNMSRQFTQVGNAVPPLLAEQIARAIGESVFAIDYSSIPLSFQVNPSDLTISQCVRNLMKQALGEKSASLYADVNLQAS